jgi:hypothetical protein
VLVAASSGLGQVGGAHRLQAGPGHEVAEPSTHAGVEFFQPFEAVTTASRLVFAPVNFMTSSRVPSGISIVVFTLLKCCSLLSCQLPFGIPKLFQKPRVVPAQVSDLPKIKFVLAKTAARADNGAGTITV